MAEISPFRGYLYNQKKVDLTEVIASPYDTIGEEERKVYYAKRFNIIHLTLPQENAPEDKYHHASSLLHQWIEDGVLLRDDKPSLYLYNHGFSINNETLVRKGFFALVGLEDSSRGRILPHEATLSSPKEDRFRLLQATRFNLSPVFLLYSDEKGEVLRLLDEDRDSPNIEFQTSDLQQHRLWKITSGKIHDRIRQIMKDKLLYIADGHHRYEAALRFWRETKIDSHRWILAYLSPLEDDNLRILAAHRLVRGFSENDWDRLVGRGSEYFWQKEISFSSLEESFSILSREGERRHAYLVLFNTGEDIKSMLLVSKNEKKLQEKMDGHSPAWKHLDISVLHSLILSHILGFEEEELQNSGRLTYVVDREKAIELVKSGDFQVAFLLNPTKVKEVKLVAERKEKMPGKATYFYPKVPSGLVIHKLEG